MTQFLTDVQVMPMQVQWRLECILCKYFWNNQVTLLVSLAHVQADFG